MSLAGDSASNLVRETENGGIEDGGGRDVEVTIGLSQSRWIQTKPERGTPDTPLLPLIPSLICCNHY